MPSIAHSLKYFNNFFRTYICVSVLKLTPILSDCLVIVLTFCGTLKISILNTNSSLQQVCLFTGLLEKMKLHHVRWRKFWQYILMMLRYFKQLEIFVNIEFALQVDFYSIQSAYNFSEIFRTTFFFPILNATILSV